MPLAALREYRSESPALEFFMYEKFTNTGADDPQGLVTPRPVFRSSIEINEVVPFQVCVDKAAKLAVGSPSRRRS